MFVSTVSWALEFIISCTFALSTCLAEVLESFLNSAGQRVVFLHICTSCRLTYRTTHGFLLNSCLHYSGDSRSCLGQYRSYSSLQPVDHRNFAVVDNVLVARYDLENFHSHSRTAARRMDFALGMGNKLDTYVV